MVEVDTIFFDLDGTLVDSTRDIANAMNRGLRDMGLPERPYEEIVSYIGTGVRYLVEKSIGASDPVLVDQGTRLYTEYYVRHPADHTVVYPHVRETLDYFDGKRKYILTNRYRIYAEAALAATGLHRHFAGVIGGDDETCIKPSPRIFSCAGQHVTYEAARSMIVGDMTVDVLTGKNAGMRTCWVSYGLGKAADVEPLGPDYAIDDISELRTIIKR